MAIVPLYGHAALRERLVRALRRGTLPASMLFQGARGVGKQRLALWLAQLLLCERFDEGADEPCGKCRACRGVVELQHPDLYWFYPRPRLKDADPRPEDVLDDYAESNAERNAAHGLYAPPSGSDGLYVATVRTIVAKAAMAPAMGRRKVFVVGDAERMVSQEGADQAANAFLKLLEEPPSDTTIMLTSSEPGALLPTIRSRVVAFRCAPLADAEMTAFLGDPVVTEAVRELDVPRKTEDRLQLAAGAPGVLFAGEAFNTALRAAQTLLGAARGGAHRAADRYAAALAQGVAGARGAFSDTLEALQFTLRDQAREALERGDARGAYDASRAVDAVLRAQACADGNVNPQLITARLLRELGATLA
jgi:DNA polymerase-3 subunit delta'